MTETTTNEFRAAVVYSNGEDRGLSPWRETVTEAVEDAGRWETYHVAAGIIGKMKIEQRITTVTTLEVPF